MPSGCLIFEMEYVEYSVGLQGKSLQAVYRVEILCTRVDEMMMPDLIVSKDCNKSFSKNHS